MPESDLRRLIALVVFAGTYAGLGIGRLPPFRVDRTGVAIIGAAVMVVTGVVPWDRAVAAVDAHTLVLQPRLERAGRAPLQVRDPGLRGSRAELADPRHGL